MKIEVGFVVNRKTGQQTPIFEEVTEEEKLAAEKEWDKKWFDILYDYVVEELDKRDKKLKEEV